MARRTTQNAISLFPFLAVLVCTMGALILLLLVTTRRIRKEQVLASPKAESTMTAAVGEDWTDPGGVSDMPDWVAADAPTRNGNAVESAVIPPPQTSGPAAKPGEPISITPMSSNPADDKLAEDTELAAAREAELKDMQSQLTRESERHQDLVQQIDAARAQLQDSSFGSDDYQAQLSNLMTLRRQESKLCDELALKKKSLTHLQAELESNSRTAEAGEQLLRDRESALISLRKIAQEKTKAASVGTDQTIIEFTNVTGTQRSPVIINVTDGGFEFLPSKVKVNTDDMEGFPANDNPLLAGIMAVHTSRTSHSLSATPYVLLLIRPGGSRFFYAAQRTLTDAGIHFGYELLEESRNIAAGPSSLDETQALRNAITDSLARRRELYGGLVAKVQALRQATPPRTQRRVRMLPDGRIAVEDEPGGERDGRFYAGGEAPPPKTDDFGGWSANGTDNRDSPAPQTPWAGRRPTSAGVGSGRTKDAEQLFENPGDPPFPPLMANARDRESQSAEVPEIIPGETGSSDSTPFSESESSGHSSGGTGRSGSTDLADLKASRLFPRNDSLSENMGVGGHRGLSNNPFAEEARPAGVPQGRTDETMADTEPSTANPFDPIFPTDTSSSERGTAQPGLRDPDRARPEPSGWSDLSTAHSDPTTRTAGTAPDSVFGPSASLPNGSPGASSGSTSQGIGGAGLTSDQQAFLQRFMQEVEARDERTKPDPYLLALLKKARHPDSTSAAATRPPTKVPQQGPVRSGDTNPRVTPSNSDSSTLDAAQKSAPLRNDDRHGMRIVLEKSRLTIGDFEAINTTSWTQQQILAVVFKGLNAELNSLRRSGVQVAAPGVEFMVAPGMEPVQQLLTKELAKVDVATRSVRPLQAATEEEYRNRAAGSQADHAQQREPAEPMETLRPGRNERGRSI